VYVFDLEYIVAAVDSNECDRISVTIWERESDGDCGAGDHGYGGEYVGGCGVL